MPPRAHEPLSAHESSSDDAAAIKTQSDTTDSAGKPIAVTVLENTPLRVRNDQPISSRMTKPGDPLSFTVKEDVVVGNLLVIPCGATVHGAIVDAKKAGVMVLTGHGQLILELNSLELGGQSYPLYTYQFKVSGASKTKPTEKKIKIGAVAGAVVLGVLSRGSANGVVTGAMLGAGAGTAVAAASPAPIVSIPAESELLFALSSPVAIVPVDAKEAARLSRGMKPGGPVLYVRDEPR